MEAAQLSQNEGNYVKPGTYWLNPIILYQSGLLGPKGKWDIVAKGRGSIRDVLSIHLVKQPWKQEQHGMAPQSSVWDQQARPGSGREEPSLSIIYTLV